VKLTLLNILVYTRQNITRVLLGSIFLAFGLNSVFNMFSTPTPPAESHDFLLGLATAPYFFPLLKGLEILCGLALITGRYVKLSLVILAPIITNICFFHAFLDYGVHSLVIPSLTLILYIQLLWQHRKELKFLMER
jgi:putative oxidoreductase